MFLIAGLDDGAPDPEPELPDDTSVSPEEYAEALKKVLDRRKLLETRKAVSNPLRLHCTKQKLICQI